MRIYSIGYDYCAYSGNKTKLNQTRLKMDCSNNLTFGFEQCHCDGGPVKITKEDKIHELRRRIYDLKRIKEPNNGIWAIGKLAMTLPKENLNGFITSTIKDEQGRKILATKFCCEEPCQVYTQLLYLDSGELITDIAGYSPLSHTQWRENVNLESCKEYIEQQTKYKEREIDENPKTNLDLVYGSFYSDFEEVGIIIEAMTNGHFSVKEGCARLKALYRCIARNKCSTMPASLRDVFTRYK